MLQDIEEIQENKVKLVLKGTRELLEKQVQLVKKD